jgi:hypothetical protein
MGCHTWFFRPIKENEIAKEHCYFSQEMFDEDRYTDIDTPHDLFRVGHFPDDTLLSLQQTMEFIEQTMKFVEQNENEYILFSENWEEKLKEFWAKNPDGVIEFG